MEHTATKAEVGVNCDCGGRHRVTPGINYCLRTNLDNEHKKYAQYLFGVTLFGLLGMYDSAYSIILQTSENLGQGVELKRHGLPDRKSGRKQSDHIYFH